MIFRRLYHDRLAQASYLVACETTRQALVVDPVRDIAPYLEAAEREEVRIAFVTETHVHADFLSGAESLAQASGAELWLSAEGEGDDASDRVGRTGARPLHDGDVAEIGRVQIEVRHTPGHTLEHLTFVVSDRATSPLAVGLLTGDFLFAGDVGRPDLLERAVGVRGSMKRSAAQLFSSLQALRDLPEYVQIWPGHGAGSACGKALGAVPQSTLGYELRSNWAFQIAGVDAFVEEVLRDQADPPRYFSRMKQLNASGAPAMPRIRPLDEGSLLDAVRRGALLVDTRAPSEFLRGHIRGALSVPLSRTFLHWAGSLLDPDRDVVLVVDRPASQRGKDAMRDLALIGFDRVLGAIEPSAFASLADSPLEHVPVIAASSLVPERDDLTVVDVRNDSEWGMGHIPGARHVPLSRLSEHLDELRVAGPLAVHCQGGARSAIAASILRAHGIDDIRDVEGGYPAWVRATNAASKGEL